MSMAEKQVYPVLDPVSKERVNGCYQGLLDLVADGARAA